LSAAATGPIRATISKGAWRRNLARLRAVAPTAKFLAVIKADAYGHGAVQAARCLEADAFGVARLGEGLELRRAGIDKPVVLMEGVFSPAELQQAVDHQLDFVVHAAHQIDWLERRPAAAVGRVVWLKLNTGMNRLGFEPTELARVYSRLSRIALVGEIRLMTHLATADEQDHALTALQLERFSLATKSLTCEVAPVFSIGNSAGILRHFATQGSWVRAGIALYGVTPTDEQSAGQLGLESVMTLESEIIALRDIAAGESVGYGASWTASRPTRIAVIAAGYADGVPRHWPSGAPVLIAGQPAPLVGRVSMDMITVDVTDIEAAQVGERVVLWGDGLPVHEVARRAGTIGYELLCRVTARVPRIYRD
jgi:alanine racemase